MNDYVVCPNCEDRLIVKFPVVAYLMVNDNGLGFDFKSFYKDKEGKFEVSCICGWSWEGSDPDKLVEHLLGKLD